MKAKTPWLRLAALLAVIGLITSFVILLGQLSTIWAQRSALEKQSGPYDILVRSKASINTLEEEYRITESNFLSTPRGGITLGQYQLIKQIPDIEVAAPVAVLGFFQNPASKVGIELASFEPDRLYQIEYSLTDESSLNPRQLDQYQAYLFSPGGATGKDLSTINIHSLVTSPLTGANFDLTGLPPMWSLVAGIDPLEEAKLIDLDKKIVSGGYFPSTDTTYALEQKPDQNTTIIPIIVHQNTYTNISAKLTVRSLPITDSKTIQQISALQRNGKTDEAANLLNSLVLAGTPHTVIDQETKLDAVLLPLSNTFLNFIEDSKPQTTYEGFSTPTDQSVALYPGEIHYTKAEPALPGNDESIFQVQQEGQWKNNVESQLETYQGNPPSTPADFIGSEPIFRSFTAVKTPPFTFVVRGVYSLAAQEEPQSEKPSPLLGIYEPSAAVLKYGADGKAVSPHTLTPGLNPGSFIPQSPLALTTIEGARYLSGKEDFIDAIRVRIAGTDPNTPEKLAKIEKIAAEIENRTGLRADIVAGSSTKTVLVSVPGIGYVEEQWLVLGNAEQGAVRINTAVVLVLIASLIILGLIFALQAKQKSPRE